MDTDKIRELIEDFELDIYRKAYADGYDSNWNVLLDNDDIAKSRAALMDYLESL